MLDECVWVRLPQLAISAGAGVESRRNQFISEVQKCLANWLIWGRRRVIGWWGTMRGNVASDLRDAIRGNQMAIVLTEADLDVTTASSRTPMVVRATGTLRLMDD